MIEPALTWAGSKGVAHGTFVSSFSAYQVPFPSVFGTEASDRQGNGLGIFLEHQTQAGRRRVVRARVCERASERASERACVHACVGGAGPDVRGRTGPRFLRSHTRAFMPHGGREAGRTSVGPPRSAKAPAAIFGAALDDCLAGVGANGPVRWRHKACADGAMCWSESLGSGGRRG